MKRERCCCCTNSKVGDEYERRGERAMLLWQIKK